VALAATGWSYTVTGVSAAAVGHDVCMDEPHPAGTATLAATRQGDHGRPGRAAGMSTPGSTTSTEIHEAVLAEEPVLEVDDFSLWYGESRALQSVTMPIPRGRVTAMIGPSGCGKSTLIRCMNRMNDIIESVRIEGDIRLDGRSIYDPDLDVIDLRKRLGMVFQKPTPFPTSVYDNVAYPLKINGQYERHTLDDLCERSLRAAALWDEVKDRLGENALRLSGGQQQRLCIARAIAGSPEVLLMDEPCSSLDPIATGEIEDLMAELRGQYTVFVVTHNMQQAARTSDYTAFMYLGRLLEYGPTDDIFTKPRIEETESYISGQFG
jgi:phosphate transport system ATP-binding protein